MSDSLVLGLGNVLLQDDGVGIRVVERFLERYDPPAGVRVLDGGVRGLSLLPYLEGASRLIIVDAIQAGQPPGTLTRLAGEDISKKLGPKLSIHQEGLADLLWAALAIDTYPQEVILWGVEPERIETSLELSPAVAAQIDALVEAVCDQLKAWGVPPRRRTMGE